MDNGRVTGSQTTDPRLNGNLPAASRTGPFLLITAAAVIAYLPALMGDFVFDDNLYIAANTYVKGEVGWGSIWTAFGGERQYYPLLNMFFRLQYALFGPRPMGYHAVTLLLHLFNAWVLLQIFNALRWKGGLWVVLLFALHPVQVQSVAWIAETKNTLSTAFLFSALWCWVRAEQKPNAARWRVLSLGCYGAALLCKTTVVILLPLMLLVHWWMNGRIARTGRAWWWAALLISLVPVGLTVYLELTAFAYQGGAPQTLADRWFLAGRVTWFATRLLLWPSQLGFMYPPMRTGSADAVLLPAAILLPGLLLWMRHRAATASFYCLELFVVSVAVMPLMRLQFVESPFADHFLYVSGLFLFVPLVAGIGWTGRYLPFRRVSVQLPVFVLLLLVLSFLSFDHARRFSSEKALWRSALETWPGNWMAHNNLGLEFLHAGRLEEAHTSFLEAVRLSPGYDHAWINLAETWMMRGRTDKAIQALDRALKLNPDSVQAHNNMGALLRAQGRPGEALPHLKAAFRLAPESVLIGMNLAQTYVLMARETDAVNTLRDIVRIHPDYGMAANNLAWLLTRPDYLNQDTRREAVVHAERAVQLNPAAPLYKATLAVAYAAAGREEDARAMARQASTDADQAGHDDVIANLVEELKRWDIMSWR